MDVQIDVNDRRLTDLATEMDGVYDRLRKVRAELEQLNASVNRNWSDEAVDDFNAKYDKGMDSIWDLQVAVDNLSGFFREAASEYKSADNKVKNL